MWWRFDLQKCPYLFSQLPLPGSNSEQDFLSFVSPFFSWYYFSLPFSHSFTPKPQSHADWVADQFKQRGFSAAKCWLAGVLWSQQYFVCGHTIKDLGVVIGRMWKSDPGSTHPPNSRFLFCLFSCTSPLSSCPFLFFGVLFSLASSLVHPSQTVTLSFRSSTSSLAYLFLLYLSMSSALHIPRQPVPHPHPPSTLSPSSCCWTWHLRLRSSVQNKPLGFPFCFHFLSPQTPGQR